MSAGAQISSEAILVATLVQLAVIVPVARIANQFLRRLGQPGVIGEILAGLVLGPSVFGAFAPDAMHAVFGPAAGPGMLVLSQVGLILLMFQIGSGFHFEHLGHAGNRRAVAGIALASLACPLAVGFGLAVLGANSLAPQVPVVAFGLFVAVAFSITAVPVLGRILQEFDLAGTPVGVIAISAAAINDVVGWVLLAAVSMLAAAQFSFASCSWQIAGIAALCLLLWTVGRPLAAFAIARFPLEAGKVPANLLAVVLVALFCAALCTSALGIFAIFGGFLVGMLFQPHRAFVEAWRVQVGRLVLVFLLPIFFTYTGLRTDIFGLTTGSDWAWCALLIVAAMGAKIVPVYFAARFTGRSHADALVCGTLMNARALMELIVLNIGLDLGVLPQKVFTMLVVMAVVTTFVTSPMLRWIFRFEGRTLTPVLEA